MLAGNRQERKLRVDTWSFSGLTMCSECNKEVGILLQVNNIDIVAAQEVWEKDGSKINVVVWEAS